MPKDVEKMSSELKKLKNMSPMSAEATVVRNYLDWMTELLVQKKYCRYRFKKNFRNFR